MVDERRALVTYKRLAVKTGLSEKIATLLVSNMGYTTREDRENLSEAQVDDKIILGLARTGVEELQNEPSVAGTDGSQTYDYVQIPLYVTVSYHARAKQFTASLPRALLPLQRENCTEITAFAETNEDVCGSPPTLPCRHQRCSGRHHHVFNQMAGQYAANKTIAGAQLGEHHCRCSWKAPGRKATDDQRGPARQRPQTEPH